jgi:nuclear transport factor 2 (NTF2) superfamily protein
VPQPPGILEEASTNNSESGGDDEDFQCHTESQSPQLFTQSERCIKRFRIVRGESLTVRLHIERKYSAGSWYRSREQEFTSYFP